MVASVGGNREKSDLTVNDIPERRDKIQLGFPSNNTDHASPKARVSLYNKSEGPRGNAYGLRVHMMHRRTTANDDHTMYSDVRPWKDANLRGCLYAAYQIV